MNDGPATQAPARGTGNAARAREALVFALALLGLLLGLHRDAAFSDKLLVPLDLLGTHEPWKSALDAGRPQNPALSDQMVALPWMSLAAERLIEDGRLTRWNPYQGCGAPLHANTLTAQLLPHMWLHALLPRHAALLAIGVLKGFLSGFFLFLLCRRLGRSLPAAWLAGLGFPLCGFLVLWLGHPHIAVASLLPCLLWLVDRAAERASPGNLAGVGLVSGMTVLAGHLETALHVLFVALAFTALRCLSLDASWWRRGVRSAQLTAAYALGALIAMVQVIPFAEYTAYSQIIHNRKSPFYRFHNAWRDLDGAAEFALAIASVVCGVGALVFVARALRRLRASGIGASLRPTLMATIACIAAFTLAFRLGLLDQLVLLIDPDRYGSPLEGRSRGGYAGYFLYLEFATGFASGTALILALFALALREKGDRVTAFLGVLVLLSLLVTFEWPLLAHAVSRAPVLAESKNKRLLLVVCLGVLLLAARGLDAAIAAARRGERRAFLAPLWCAAVLLIGIGAGRFLAAPPHPVGTPIPPTPAITPVTLVRGAIADGRSQHAALLGHVRGSDARNAHHGDRLQLEGYVFARARPDRVRLLLASSLATRTWTVALDAALPGDVRDAHALLEPQFVAHTFTLDADVADLPSGAYRLHAVLLQADLVVGELPPTTLHLARPVLHLERVLFPAAALLVLLLIALLPGAAPVLALLLVALVVADLFRFGDGFNPAVNPRFDFPETPAIAWLKEKTASGQDRIWADPPVTLLPANTATAYRLRDVRLYDSIDVYYYHWFLQPLVLGGAEGNSRALLDVGRRMYDLLAARYHLAHRGSPAPAPHFAEVWSGEIVIRENLRSLPRAYVAREAVSEGALLAAMGVPAAQHAERRADLHLALRVALDLNRMDPVRSVLVHEPERDRIQALLAAALRVPLRVRTADGVDDGATPAFDLLAELPEARAAVLPGTARFLVDGMDELVIETRTDFPGVLVLADTWMPGWKARVDGIEVPLARANIAFRAVAVPAGVHEVEIYYDPDSLRLGQRLALVGLALTSLLLLIQACRRSSAT